MIKHKLCDFLAGQSRRATVADRVIDDPVQLVPIQHHLVPLLCAKHIIGTARCERGSSAQISNWDTTRVSVGRLPRATEPISGTAQIVGQVRDVDRCLMPASATEVDLGHAQRPNVGKVHWWAGESCQLLVSRVQRDGGKTDFGSMETERGSGRR